MAVQNSESGEYPTTPPYHVIKASDGTMYLREHALGLVNECMGFMRLVVDSDLSFHAGALRAYSFNVKHQTAIAKHLRWLSSYARIYRVGYHYHPLIAFFLDAYRRHPLSEVTNFGPYAPTTGNFQVWQVFDDFVSKMRVDAVSTKLKKAVRDWDGKVKKNKQRCDRLEKAVFERRSRVVVIRVDLSYREKVLTPAECKALCLQDEADRIQNAMSYRNGADIEGSGSDKVLNTFEQVQAHRTRLFANMKGKPSLFKHLLAYVWRIECTPFAGFHIHAVFMFNGSDVHKDEWLAQGICEYWETTITNGEGRAYNCNRHWNSSALNCGIGTIESTNGNKRRNLRTHVLGYLCKSSQPVALLPYKGCKVFGSHFVHRDNAKGRGRPRVKGANQGDGVL